MGFLSVDPRVDQNLFWNPDLLILGTETYNHHPETGMIEPQPSGREFSHAIIGINIFKGKDFSV